METREEKLATWADLSVDGHQTFRFLEGSMRIFPNDPNNRARFAQDRFDCSHIDHLLNIPNDDNLNSWHFKVISFPQIQLGRLRISISKPVFRKIQNSWNLHPRTIEVFLANNGVFTTFHCSSSGRTFFLLKVANSRSTGFDCISVTCDPCRRTTYVLYHHIRDEESVFATLTTALERCMDPLFFIAALYRSHNQQIETYRNTIDDAILKIERQTGLGVPANLRGRRASLDEEPLHFSSTGTIQQLSYCQSDVAIIKHVGRCCLECGDWLVQLFDKLLLSENERYSSEEHSEQDHQLSKALKTARLMNRDDVEYMRRRSKTLLSQIQQIGERAQSQTNFLLAALSQSDTEYSASIAIDGKNDSHAMKAISILGAIYLPGTCVATLLSMEIFIWRDPDGTLKISPSIWIYWTIALPLTIATFVVWIAWSRRENKKSEQQLTISHTKPRFEPDGNAKTNTVLDRAGGSGGLDFWHELVPRRPDIWKV
ncbi:hypothetical protein N7481_012573 [Penicillium waksmanii]|uniref:uncharacterized protein n=1 Tax=Penicillium waksmanii TaxID=69791 RepID=UPI002546DB06|nr:uncharacterized protein N7481_012573 [Penicillium waksmanii]KAJ5965859.1 hypothetical protein N7481_012573 [Penicillium waksmanii]